VQPCKRIDLRNSKPDDVAAWFGWHTRVVSLQLWYAGRRRSDQSPLTALIVCTRYARKSTVAWRYSASVQVLHLLL